MERAALSLLLAPVIAMSMAFGHASAQARPAAVGPSARAVGTGAAGDPLVFPRDKYTEETRTVRTSTGEKQVTVRSYKHIPYVADPVDADYQSLDVAVPVQVDGKAVDATHAPILFRIGVGGYMSSRNAGGAAQGGRMGGPPEGRVGGPPAGRGMGGPGGAGNISRNTDLALAAGYVVVSPGCRGRDNRATDGTFYGKAPAAIVDLKAAVRYVRHNAGVMPGNVNWIVTTGVSAGGALSALLGASGGYHLYDAYLKEIGAADADDAVFASADFCPIMDLDHADMAYEWMYGAVPARSGLVNQELSKQLRDAFAAYQASLKLQGKSGFGTLTADNYATYLLKTYLFPSANKYLKALTEEQRSAYLAKNPWLTWSDKGAAFTFTDYLAHVGRMKRLPAFDDFEMRQPEPNEFGNKTTDSRHFTTFSLRQATGNPSAGLDDGLQAVVNLMNPMYFIGQNNPGMAGHWWIRMGTSDNHTSLTVVGNLAASLENRKKDVNAWLYWDAGHGADEDAEDFIAWIGRITGFTGRR
jgi:hypothetical protein